MTFTERRQRVTDDSGILVYLEVSCPSFTETLRIVNDTQDWESNGLTYIGFPFQFKLPDDSSGGVPRAQLQISNVGGQLQEQLERVGPNELVMAKIIISDRADPDHVEQYFYLPLTNVSCNAMTITAQAGADYLMRQQAVRLRANPFTLPGLFN